MAIKPVQDIAIWENIQTRTGQEDLKRQAYRMCNMPIFIPESLLQKEKDHVEGFAT